MATLLILDEIGYLALNSAQASLLLQVMPIGTTDANRSSSPQQQALQ